MQEHGSDLAREGFRRLRGDMPRGLDDPLGTIFDEVTDGIGDLQFVSEQPCR